MFKKASGRRCVTVSEGESANESEQRRSRCLILGCGSLGFAVARELKSRGFDVHVVDIDETRLELLKQEGFSTLACDIREENTAKKLTRQNCDFDVIFILSNSAETNRLALLNIKKEFSDAYVVVRATDAKEKEELEGLGADVVLFPLDIITEAAVRQVEKIKTEKRMKRLIRTIKSIGENRKYGIVVHDNPDPDAIASALALRYIMKENGICADILYGGIIGHQVNRAFVNLLGIEMRRIESDVLREYSKFALIDATVPGSNNSLPAGTKVSIIIDHHPASNGVDAEFYDREELGATSTILTKYLRWLNLPVDKVLATALLYGIKTDTNGFKRNAHPEDFIAAAFLYPRVDRELLDQIETPPVSAETVNIIGKAIQNRKIRHSYLISNVGFIANRDALAQAADYLLNLEGVTVAIVIGMNDENIYVSGRSKDIRVNLGEAFRQAFDKIGSAGGHSTTAAAQIPLGLFSGVKEKDTLIKLAEDAITKRFLAVIGVDDGGEG
ncbi:NAD-binding protein [Candidatus Alkanophaga liquidiphilum]